MTQAVSHENIGLFWLRRRSSVTRKFTSERLSNLDPLTGNGFPGFEVLQYSDRSAVVTAVCPYIYQIIFAPEESLRLVPLRFCEKSIELGLRRRSNVTRELCINKKGAPPCAPT